MQMESSQVPLSQYSCVFVIGVVRHGVVFEVHSGKIETVLLYINLNFCLKEM